MDAQQWTDLAIAAVATAAAFGIVLWPSNKGGKK
jgi:hypothetical protein